MSTAEIEIIRSGDKYGVGFSGDMVKRESGKWLGRTCTDGLGKGIKHWRNVLCFSTE